MTTQTYRGYTITTKTHALGFIATVSGLAKRPISRTGGSLFVTEEVKRIIDRKLDLCWSETLQRYVQAT